MKKTLVNIFRNSISLVLEMKIIFKNKYMNDADNLIMITTRKECNSIGKIIAMKINNINISTGFMEKGYY